jgi:hypothetical protein
VWTRFSLLCLGNSIGQVRTAGPGGYTHGTVVGQIIYRGDRPFLVKGSCKVCLLLLSTVPYLINLWAQLRGVLGRDAKPFPFPSRRSPPTTLSLPDTSGCVEDLDQYILHGVTARRMRKSCMLGVS